MIWRFCFAKVVWMVDNLWLFSLLIVFAYLGIALLLAFLGLLCCAAFCLQTNYKLGCCGLLVVRLVLGDLFLCDVGCMLIVLLVSLRFYGSVLFIVSLNCCAWLCLWLLVYCFGLICLEYLLVVEFLLVCCLIWLC